MNDYDFNMIETFIPNIEKHTISDAQIRSNNDAIQEESKYQWNFNQLYCKLTYIP